MAKIRLDLSQFKSSGIYTVEFDASESIVLNTQTTRLVVGFSKKGPINAPVFCQDVKTARRIFGDVDSNLEKKGSFFHRSLFTCLETGPCFALALMPLNDDLTTSNPDTVLYKSFSVSTTEANGSTASELYSSFFNKERFYFPDTTYFQANVDKTTSSNIGKLLSFVNLGQSPFSIIVRKTGDLTGFNITARDWYSQLPNTEIPPYVKEFDFISEYFVQIDVVAGDWTNLSTLAIDPIYSTYFDSKGLKKDQITAFLNNTGITRLGSFQGSLIPDLVDGNGVNYSIDTIVNSAIATTGLFVSINREALADYDAGATHSSGAVDMIGHTLIQNSVDNVNFLSYNFAAKEYYGYTAQSPAHSAVSLNGLRNTYTYDLGVGATTNLPTGLGSTGASYSVAANGLSGNDPGKVAYFTSFYGSGNEGKFNNILNLRKEAFSTTEYDAILNLTAGSSIALEGPSGATQYATITSVNEVLVGSDTRLKLGIAHPDKATEGTTSGKNAPVLSTGANYIIVSGTAAAATINFGDWIYTQNGSVRYYFRVTSSGATGSNSQLFVDVTNSEFDGSTNIANITTFYTAYWESVSGSAGSLFDIINPYAFSGRSEFKFIARPDVFKYVSGSTNFYTAYEYSPAYEAFESGVLTKGDIVYVSGPTPLYLDVTFGRDTDNVQTMQINAYRDSSLTIGYTGAWNISDIKDSAGATASEFRVYSLVGDFVVAVGATGFNSTRTKTYITSGVESNVQVGQYLVSDPQSTGDSTDFILTRVLAKRKITGGTYDGMYEITVNQKLPSTGSYANNIYRYKRIEQAAPAVQFTYLPGFRVGSYHMPGSATQLTKILGMLDVANSNLPVALASRHIISFRYIVDTFNGGLAQQSAPKNIVTKLAKDRQKCMAIMNAPSIKEFTDSTDPRFTELPTDANPKPLLNTAYIASGGNLSLGPSFTYSLPDEENGAKFAGFFAPFLTLRENNKNINVPPAADVSNNFIRKFVNGQPYSIVAGPRRGVLSNPKLVGLEYDFSDTDRDNLEPMGWNPIVFRKGTGFMIYANQTAYQKTNTAFNSLHVRDLLITIEEAVEDVLANFIFEFNDASTRLQIKSIVDAYLDNVRSAGGIGNFETIMDESNNTNDIIDQNFAIIDIGIEPARGAQKFINRVTVLKTGGISSGGFTIA